MLTKLLTLVVVSTSTVGPEPAIQYIKDVDTCNQSINMLYAQTRRCIGMLDATRIERNFFREKSEILETPPEPVVLVKTTTITEDASPIIYGSLGLAGIAVGFLLAMIVH